MVASLGASNFQLAFQVSPIILTNGVATNLPGGMLPIVSITDSQIFSSGILSGAGDVDLDDFFAQFIPLSGSALINQEIAHYPFANQAVAANATIQNPNTISFKMICPVREVGGYTNKRAIITSLKSTLDQHNQSGGTYTLATPSYIYASCLMTSFRDITSGEGKQVQQVWQLDFEQPLLTEDQAAQSLNNLMNKIASGTKFNGPPAWSGLEPTTGWPPSLAGSSAIPAAQGGSSSNTALPQSALVIPQ